MRRIVAETAGKSFGAKSGKITATLRVGNQVQLANGCRLGKERFRIIGEEKQLVGHDGAAKREPKIIVVQRRPGRDLIASRISAANERSRRILQASMVILPAIGI